MILTEKDIKQIFDTINNEQIRIKCNMSLLENKFKYWRVINDDPNYTFIKLIQEYQDNICNFDNNYKDKICESICENLIYNISDELKNNINNRKINIDEYLRENLCNSIDKIKCYNRISDNIKRINKKFNFDSLMKRNKFLNENDELSDINTFDEIVENVISSYSTVDKKELYHITLESILLYNYEHRLHNSVPFVVYEVTRAFVENDTFKNEDEVIKSLKNVENIIECDNNIRYYLNDDYIINENNLKIRKGKSIKDLIKGLQIKPIKTPSAVKSFLNKIYAKPEKDIVNESPFILGYVRRGIVIAGPHMIHPLLGILSGLVDYLISNHINRNSAEKYLNKLKKEKEISERKMNKAKSEKTKERLNEYIKQIDSDIDKIENYLYSLKSDKENETYDDEIEECSIVRSMAATMAIIESYEYFNTENYKNITDILVEGKFLTNLKLAGEALKGKIKKLSGKEKELCTKLDNSMENFTNNLEKSLTMKKREDIIKGKILPSYSRMVKMLLAGGAIYAVNPILAATTALASLAVSKKATMREKQYILDEIDINLKITEKKINQAEIRGDDEALEDLYKTKMKLEREKQRIKYNMKVYYNK